MKEKGMSKGEFTSVAQANGGLENMVNWEGKDQDTLALIRYIAEEDKLAKVLENPCDPHTDCQKRETVYHRLSAGGMEGLELRKREGMGQ